MRNRLDSISIIIMIIQMELRKGCSTTTAIPLLLVLTKTYNPPQATTHNHHITTWINNNSNYNNNNKMIMKKFKYNQKINSLVMIKLTILHHVILIGSNCLLMIMMMMIWRMLRSILCLIFDEKEKDNKKIEGEKIDIKKQLIF